MKYSTVLTSALLGSFAAALPAAINKRDIVTKTSVVVETVVVFTTVWDDELPAETAAATATSVDGLFYEQPPKPTTTTQAAPAETPKAAETPAAAPSVETPAPQPTTTTPAPEPTTTTPAPEPTTTAQATTQAPVQQQPTTTQQAAPATTTQASSGGSTSGETYSNVDITIYDNNGGFGACGTELHDGDMIVALAQSAWGASTYDVMTGAATNPWCGQEIQVEYNGNKINAKIMDMCPGCSGHDIDLSLSAWKALTGLDEKTRLKASWSKVA